MNIKCNTFSLLLNKNFALDHGTLQYFLVSCFNVGTYHLLKKSSVTHKDLPATVPNMSYTTLTFLHLYLLRYWDLWACACVHSCEPFIWWLAQATLLNLNWSFHSVFVS